MAADHKAPQVMKWKASQDDGEEGGDDLSQTSAASVVTTVTHLARSHSADRTPRSSVGLGFLAKYGKTPRVGRQTPEPTSGSFMAVRILRLEQILG